MGKSAVEEGYGTRHDAKAEGMEDEQAKEAACSGGGASGGEDVVDARIWQEGISTDGISQLE